MQGEIDDEDKKKKERVKKPIGLEKIVEEGKEALVKQGANPETAKVLAQTFPLSSAHKLQLVEQLNKKRKPYLYIRFHQTASGVKCAYIEARNSYIIKDVLREMQFQFKKDKNKSWVLDRALTAEELKQLLNKLAEKTSAIIVEDASYPGLKKIYDPQLEYNTMQDRKITKYAREQLKLDVKKEPTPQQKPSKASAERGISPEPATVAPPPKTNAPNPHEDAKELSGEPEIEEDDIKIDKSAFDNKKQGYFATHKNISNRAAKIERAISAALEEFAHIMETELVYVQFQKDRLNIAVDNAYRKKEQLKAHGYTFDSATKTWNKKINVQYYEKEIEQLNKMGIDFVMPLGLTPHQAEKEMEKATHYKNHYRTYYKGGREYKQTQEKKQPYHNMGVSP